MAVKASEASLRRIIERNGKRWKLVPMDIDGRVLVAEDIAFLMTTHNGVRYMERLRRDITAISDTYTFSMLLRNRRHASERRAYARVELARDMKKKDRVNQLEAVEHELKGDLRNLRKIIVPVRGP